MPTLRTILGGIGRVNFYQLATSLFRFVRKLRKELRPCCIQDALSDAVIVNHTIDSNIFNCNYSKAIDYHSRKLVGEIVAFPSDTFVDFGNNLTLPLILWRAFFETRKLTLCFYKFLLFGPEKPWSFDLLTSRKCGERAESYVKCNSFGTFRKRNRFDLTSEDSIPFACCRPFDGASFDFTFKRTVENDLNFTNTRQMEFISVNPETKLRIGEALIAANSFKTRVARLFTVVYTAKEVLKGKVNTYGDVLKNLGIDETKRRTSLLKRWKSFGLFIVEKAYLGFFPSFASFFEKVVEKPAALFKPLVHYASLLLSRIDAVLEHFNHSAFTCLKNTLYLEESQVTIHPRSKIKGILVELWKENAILVHEKGD
jgi:hypothetical protein